ncbi:MAG: hypothetical protein FJ410_01415 [Verrucomicrobia bacterium]|nr:hypothetical protein [Verrucomicrobiota bacterium]
MSLPRPPPPSRPSRPWLPWLPVYRLPPPMPPRLRRPRAASRFATPATSDSNHISDTSVTKVSVRPGSTWWSPFPCSGLLGGPIQGSTQ